MRVKGNARKIGWHERQLIKGQQARARELEEKRKESALAAFDAALSGLRQEEISSADLPYRVFTRMYGQPAREDNELKVVGEIRKRLEKLGIIGPGE